MITKIFGRIAISVAALAFAVPLEARPVIFVPDDPGYAWWTRDLVLRPTSTAIGSVTVQQINDHLSARRGMRSHRPICLVDAVAASEVVSIDRATQLDIDQTLSENPSPFFARLTTGNGQEFGVQVVVFERCEADPVTGFALLITRSDGSFHTFDVQDFRFIRLFKRDDGQINVFGCFSCGDVSELTYDASNDRFCYNWIGH